MKLSTIRTYPTGTPGAEALDPSLKDGPMHESCFRCYHILEKVKQWLEDGVPAATILELVAELEE